MTSLPSKERNKYIIEQAQYKRTTNNAATLTGKILIKKRRLVKNKTSLLGDLTKAEIIRILYNLFRIIPKDNLRRIIVKAMSVKKAVPPGCHRTGEKEFQRRKGRELL